MQAAAPEIATTAPRGTATLWCRKEDIVTVPRSAYRIRTGFTHAFQALLRGRFNRFYGRFAFPRRLVGLSRRLLDRFEAPPPSRPSLFPPLPLAEAMRRLRREGIWCGLSLPQDCVVEIAAFARQAPCRLARDNGERFPIGAVRDGRTPGGTAAPLAEVACPRHCPVIARLVEDGQLLEAARRYLGFRPRQVRPRLYWSPLLQLDNGRRHAGGQTVDFHFDIEPSRALYVFFYIEGGQQDSGAHVAIAGSHRRKPLRLALAPAFQPDHVLFRFFPRSNERVLTGPPGFGFLEDPACYHKALPPLAGHRLVLQLRIS